MELVIFHSIQKQEAQLMLINARDAFRGQSRSPNVVPFHMLRIIYSFLFDPIGHVAIVKYHSIC